MIKIIKSKTGLKLCYAEIIFKKKKKEEKAQ